MQTKKRTLAEIVAILGLLLSAGGCRHGHTPAPAPQGDFTVPPPSAPLAPTVTLTAQPNTVARGQSVTLSWFSQNAMDLDLAPGVGKVAVGGSMSITPMDSITYVLTATGPGGTETATARVSVYPPAPPPPPVVGEGGGLVAISVKDAYFDFDKANIRPDAEQTLATDAGFLNEHPGIKFTLEGQCDERGSEEYNLGLGDRRATAAKDFLVNAGVSSDRVYTISFGKSQPVCTDRTEECWQKNRRAHFHYGAETK